MSHSYHGKTRNMFLDWYLHLLLVVWSFVPRLLARRLGTKIWALERILFLQTDHPSGEPLAFPTISPDCSVSLVTLCVDKL